MLLSKPQSCSPQLFPKAALQNYYRKPLPKNAPQNSNVITRSCLKAGPEGCPKLLPKAFFFGPSPLPFGGSTLLRLTRGPAGNRTTTGSLSAPYQLSHEDTYKVAPQSCCPKLFPGAAPQSCAPKLFSKAAILQTCSPKRLPKAILQSGS